MNKNSAIKFYEKAILKIGIKPPWTTIQDLTDSVGVESVYQVNGQVIITPKIPLMPVSEPNKLHSLIFKATDTGYKKAKELLDSKGIASGVFFENTFKVFECEARNILELQSIPGVKWIRMHD